MLATPHMHVRMHAHATTCESAHTYSTQYKLTAAHPKTRQRLHSPRPVPPQSQIASAQAGAPAAPKVSQTRPRVLVEMIAPGEQPQVDVVVADSELLSAESILAIGKNGGVTETEKVEQGHYAPLEVRGQIG